MKRFSFLILFLLGVSVSANLMAESCPVGQWLAWPPAGNYRGWCCPNGYVRGTNLSTCVPGYTSMPMATPIMTPATWNQSNQAIFHPGANLDSTAVSCRNSIINAIPVVGQVTSVYTSFRSCLGSATVPEQIGNCISVFCAAVPGARGCTMNGYLYVLADCSQFFATATANFVIPNTMDRLNTGLFSGCISQGSCTSCKRCCGAFGDSGGSNDNYYRCLSSCANIQGGLHGLSMSCRRQAGLPLQYDRSVDSPCVSDYANWTAGQCR